MEISGDLLKRMGTARGTTVTQIYDLSLAVGQRLKVVINPFSHRFRCNSGQEILHLIVLHWDRRDCRTAGNG
jgi:hypothetical protein